MGATGQDHSTLSNREEVGSMPQSSNIVKQSEAPTFGTISWNRVFHNNYLDVL